MGRSGKHKKAKTKNPFDSSSSNESSASAAEEFFECKQDVSGEMRPQRIAPLDFSANIGVDERPAVDFQKHPSSSPRNFFSPLVGAMMEYGDQDKTAEKWTYAGDDSDLSSISDGDTTEQSSLLSGKNRKNYRYSSKNTSFGASSSSLRRSSHKAKNTTVPKARQVMTELQGGESEFSVDYKFILLEDLGTASSWLVLLLPYLAFLVCLVLESNADGINIATSPMMNASIACPQNSPVPLNTCYRPLDSVSDIFGLDESPMVEIDDGFAFDSGIQMPRIPVVSNFLHGDVTLDGLSTEVVSLVAQGKVLLRHVLLQRRLGQAAWSHMFRSDERTLSMACELPEESSFESTMTATWNCKSPQIMDVVFSMPEVSAYAGGDLRVVIAYYLARTSKGQIKSYDKDLNRSFVYSNVPNATGLFTTLALDETSQFIEEMASASSFTFEFTSETGATIDTCVRLVSFVVTLFFFIYWLWSMSSKDLVCKCSPGFFRLAASPRKETMWWESPWMLFPERTYIVVLLLGLLAMQEPLLVAMYFHPELGSMTANHFVADACMGIGVQFTLFVYLCLFHGFRYHTASVSKRRTEQQRKVLQLRRAAKYITDAQGKTGNEASISDYERDYYERFGDIDGTASSSHMRLQNDPCGDGWADFLLFKLLLLLIGCTAVVVTAYCRFPTADGEGGSHLSRDQLDQFKTVYIASSFFQLLCGAAWIFLIIEAAWASGEKLRREPFLNTRPVQLAFRILFAHMTLGFIALLVTFTINILRLEAKWTLHRRQFGYAQMSTLDILMKVLPDIARQFPYSGTASSVGSGRIFFASVAILITAFIFLPANVLNDDDAMDFDQSRYDGMDERRRQKRDKRTVTRLIREAKSWRVLPLPIKDIGSATFRQTHFQLFQSLNISTGDAQTRGMVSVGPYTPMFCLETACWLNEASWQAYYPPPGLMIGTESMNLEALGLKLEGAVVDSSTNVQAFVATNLASQVDGEQDSIIVVGFRGTANSDNVLTDLRLRQIPLFDQIAGIGTAAFKISTEGVDVYDSEGWIWDTPVNRDRAEDVQCVIPQSLGPSGCVPSLHKTPKHDDVLTETVKKGAKAILRASPTFPYVHEGFLTAYCHVRQKIIEILLPCLQRQLKKAINRKSANSGREPLALPKMYICGHSLGGSLAQLLALDLANNCEIMLQTQAPAQSPSRGLSGPEEEIFHSPAENMDSLRENAMLTDDNGELSIRPPIAVYTFGQPRLGNRAFSRLYKQKVPHTFRVCNEGDAITSMPSFVFCNGVYKHAGLEVLLDEGQTGNVLVGPTVVETTFRFSKVRTNVMAHRQELYRDGLECAFDSHELQQYYQGHMGDGVSHSANGQEHTHPSNTTIIPDWMTHVGSANRQNIV